MMCDSLCVTKIIVTSHIMWSNYYYFLLLRVTNIVVKAPQNWMVLGVYGRHPFHLYFVLCGILQEFLLSSQCHFYYILLLTVTNIVVKAPQNWMMIGAYERHIFHLSFVLCGMLQEFLLSSKNHFYYMLLYFIIDIDQHNSKKLHRFEWW